MVLGPDAQPLTIQEIVKRVDAPLWALIDGVSCPELAELVADGAPACCLYRADTVAEAPHAPWLLRIDPDGPLVSDLGILPGDRHWGVVFSARSRLRDLRVHFRKFTMLHTPSDATAPVYFRFYDPRVLSDALQALAPEKAAGLMAPVAQVFVPVSPLLGDWTGLSPLAGGDVYRGHFLELALPPLDPAHVVFGARAFRVGDLEYERMTALQAVRSTRKLARDLRLKYRSTADEIILKAAELAAPSAREHGLTSVSQVFLMGCCMVRFGPDFVRTQAEAARILTTPTRHAWQRSDALHAWFDAAEQTAREEVQV